MFESVGRTMIRHKQIVIAALAVSGMLLYAIPAQQLAIAQNTTFEEEAIVQEEDLAQRIVDETRQRIDQDAEQEQEQEQEQEIEQDIDQTNEANVDQSEVNNQNNVISTGDNTATTTQIGDNDATDNELTAKSEGGSAEFESKHGGGSATGGASSAEAALEQDVDNTATTTQDSSADDNVQVNTNTFGNDIAVVDQDNTADQDAINVGIQTQEQDLNQYAANVDLTANVAEQAQDAFLCDPDEIDVFAPGGGPGDTTITQDLC